MSFITVGQENSATVDIHYEDHGQGPPVVLIHGYPLTGNSWEKQERMLLENGYRVITYDRRGFGKSSQPTTGYDYDTFASDLDIVLDTLQLTGVVLVGFSMGSGEVTRYLSKYGTDRVRKAVLMATIPPFLLKTDDNPEGVDGSVFDQMRTMARTDRPAFLKSFLDNFYNMDMYGGNLVSEPAWRDGFHQAISMSPYAAVACIDTWLTDFRADLPAITVPTLVVHGDADRILPYEHTAKRLPGMIPDMNLVTIEGGPHAICWTHADQVNRALLDFIKS
ncbi:MAG: alpha/beta hydrolase [Micromonosporaceae bacterium]|jgi:non-heme chloroperoxidase|nr:alpha/beta hydrolase [Micromonosporaceae bacterium]